jgi:hypothetical protein
MDDKSSISVEIPDPEYFEDDWPHVYIPVTSGVVDSGIDLLQCMLAQWKHEEGMQSDEQVWDRLMVSAAQMLTGLLSAWTDYYHRNQARKLIDQVAWFCHWSHAQKDLESVHGRPLHLEETTGLQDADVAAALRPLHQLSQRRLAEQRQQREESQRKQRKQEQEQAAADQAPFVEGDVGWDF